MLIHNLYRALTYFKDALHYLVEESGVQDIHVAQKKDGIF